MVYAGDVGGCHTLTLLTVPQSRKMSIAPGLDYRWQLGPQTRPITETGKDAGTRRDPMSRIITLLFVVVLLSVLPAGSLPLSAETTTPSPGVLWMHQFGGVTSISVPTFAYAVAVNGDVYMAGSTEGALPGQISAGKADVYIRKYDVNGAELWTRQFGSSWDDYIWSLAMDTSGVYLVGFTHGALPGQAHAGSYIRKYDVHGNEAWTRQIASDWDTARSVAVDSSGVYVVGRASDALPGQTSVGSYIRKYDTNGNEVWTRQFSSASIRSAATDSSDVYVAGSLISFSGPSLQSVAVGSSGVYVAGSLTSSGGADAFIRKYSVDGDEVWTRQFGTTSDEAAWNVAVDDSGIYLVGETRGALPGQIHAGDVDVFVRKYSADGNEVWTNQFGSASFDYARAITVNSSGVYMTGYMGSSSAEDAVGNYTRKYDLNGNEVWTQYLGYSNFGAPAGIAVDSSGVYQVGNPNAPLPGQTSSGGYIRKYNVDGVELWTRQFHAIKTSPASDSASAIAVYGDLYVVGWTSGALPGQIHAGNSDAYLRKYNTDGSEAWTRQFGSVVEYYPSVIAVNSSGIYVSGATSDTLPDQVNVGGVDVCVRKYDVDGNEVWTRQFGSSERDFANGIAADSSAIYVVGETSGTLPNATSAGESDAYVRKYDIDGNEIWTRQFGSSRSDGANAIVVDSSGVYVAGYTWGTLPNQTSTGGTDAYIRKYDLDGNELWTRQFGSGISAHAYGVAVDSSGIYVAGHTYSALPGQTHAGEADAYVRKYDLDGNEVWTRQFGTTRLDGASAIVVDGSGIYVVGSTFGILPDQAGVRYFDAYVRKYDTDGNEIWTYQFGSMSDDFASGVAVDSLGLYIVGEIERPIPGDTEADPSDAFIVKLTKDAFEWEKVYLPAIHID
jgi:hypothetical protein